MPNHPSFKFCIKLRVLLAFTFLMIIQRNVAQDSLRALEQVDIDLASGVILDKMIFDTPFAFKGLLPPSGQKVKKVEYRYRIRPSNANLKYVVFLGETKATDFELSKSDIRVKTKKRGIIKRNNYLEYSPPLTNGVDESKEEVIIKLLEKESQNYYQYRFPANSNKKIVFLSKGSGLDELNKAAETPVRYEINYEHKRHYFPNVSGIDNQGFTQKVTWNSFTGSESHFFVQSGSVHPNLFYEFEFTVYQNNGIDATNQGELKTKVTKIIKTWSDSNYEDITNENELNQLNTRINNAIKGYVIGRIVDLDGSLTPVDMRSQTYQPLLSDLAGLTKQIKESENANKEIRENLSDAVLPLIAEQPNLPNFYRTLNRIQNGNSLNQSSKAEYISAVGNMPGFESISYNDIGQIISEEENFISIVNGALNIVPIQTDGEQSTSYSISSKSGDHLVSIQLINLFLEKITSSQFVSTSNESPFDLGRIRTIANYLIEFEKQIKHQKEFIDAKNSIKSTRTELIGKDGYLTQTFNITTSKTFYDNFVSLNSNSNQLDDRSKAIFSTQIPIEDHAPLISYQNLVALLSSSLLPRDLSNTSFDKFLSSDLVINGTTFSSAATSPDLVAEKIASMRTMIRFFEDIKLWKLRNGQPLFQAGFNIDNLIADFKILRDYYLIEAEIYSPEQANRLTKFFYQIEELRKDEMNPGAIADSLINYHKDQLNDFTNAEKLLTGKFELIDAGVVLRNKIYVEEIKKVINAFSSSPALSDVKSDLEEIIKKIEDRNPTTQAFGDAINAIKTVLTIPVDNNIEPKSNFDLVDKFEPILLSGIDLSMVNQAVDAQAFLVTLQSSLELNAMAIIKKEKIYDVATAALVDSNAKSDAFSIDLFLQLLEQIDTSDPTVIQNMADVKLKLEKLVTSWKILLKLGDPDASRYQILKDRLANGSSSLLFGGGIGTLLDKIEADPTKELSPSALLLWESTINGAWKISEVSKAISAGLTNQTLHLVFTGEKKIEKTLLKDVTPASIDTVSIKILRNFYRVLNRTDLKLKGKTEPAFKAFETEIRKVVESLSNYLVNLNDQKKLVIRKGEEDPAINTTLTNLYVQNTLLRQGSSIVETNNRNTPYIGLDAGYAVVPSLNGFTTYTGLNIYLAPVYKRTNFSRYPRLRNKFWKSFSFLVGFTMTESFEDSRFENLTTGPDTNMIVGFGFRVNPIFRFNYGFLAHKEKRINPLDTNRDFAASQFFSVSFDINIIKGLSDIPDLFKP